MKTKATVSNSGDNMKKQARGLRPRTPIKQLWTYVLQFSVRRYTELTQLPKPHIIGPYQFTGSPVAGAPFDMMTLQTGAKKIPRKVRLKLKTAVRRLLEDGVPFAIITGEAEGVGLLISFHRDLIEQTKAPATLSISPRAA